MVHISLFRHMHSHGLHVASLGDFNKESVRSIFTCVCVCVCVCVYILKNILFHYGFSQEVGYSSQCESVGPYYLSILN